MVVCFVFSLRGITLWGTGGGGGLEHTTFVKREELPSTFCDSNTLSFFDSLDYSFFPHSFSLCIFMKRVFATIIIA